MLSNGDFDEYWRYHLTREHQRIVRNPRKANRLTEPVALTW